MDSASSRDEAPPTAHEQDPPASRSTGRIRSWVNASPRRKLFVWTLSIYLIASLAYVLAAPRDLFSEHTSFNHFAHLADSWLHGQLSMRGEPPGYAQNNDFARYDGNWYVIFPPFPTLLLLPFVALAGEPELVRDGQVFLWLAGVGPACLFLALERLRELRHSRRVEWENAVLALCFALGSVFFFTAVQGTVWFAAHVVSIPLAALYVWCALDATRPVLAGCLLGLGFLTRAPLLFAFPLFALEALRVSTTNPGTGTLRQRVRAMLAGMNWRQLAFRLGGFALPVLLCVGFMLWHNAARFDDPLENGYRYLTVAWQKRMTKWGLFHYHYLAKNLGVLLTNLPWADAKSWFRINVHGLALWFTTPLYLWLFWPAAKPKPHLGLWLTVACVAVPTLFYQNTGWAQFGYRFSNDYAVFLFVLLAAGMRPLRGLFAAAALWAVLVNGFGAFTFQRNEYRHFYYWQGSQKTLYQPD